MESKSEALFKEAHKKFEYDKATGHLIYKQIEKDGVSPAVYQRHQPRVGKPAGCANQDGYIKVSMSDKYYSAHRIIWLMMTGEMPEYPFFEIDHLNGDPADNRWVNLRKVSKSENQRNGRGRVNNTSGVHGVNWKKNKLTGGGKWVARIWNGPTHVYLGAFDDIEMAKVARKAGERVLGFRENNKND